MPAMGDRTRRNARRDESRAERDFYYSDGDTDGDEPGRSNCASRPMSPEFRAQDLARRFSRTGQTRVPSRQPPDPHRRQPRQEATAGDYDATYPEYDMNYPHADLRQETFPPHRPQPINPNNTLPQQQQPMPSYYVPEPCPRHVYPAGPQPFPHLQQDPFYHLVPPPQPPSQPPQPQPSPPSPPPPPSQPPTQPSETEHSIRQLQDTVAFYRAKDERQRIEKEVREEYETQIRQLKAQLGKAEQDVSRALAHGRQQGEKTAWETFKNDRLAFEEEKRQTKQRMAIENDIKVRLEAERLAGITIPEARERRPKQSQRQGTDSRLERLEDSMRILQERLLRGPRPEKESTATEDAKHGLESVVTELKALMSDFRQSIAMSNMSQQSASVSSRGRNSTFSSGSQSPHHQLKGVSDSDTSPPQSPSPLSREGNQAGLKEPPPPALDASRGACDRDENGGGMGDHRWYRKSGWSQPKHDPWDSGPGRQHDPSHKRGPLTSNAHSHSSYREGPSGAARGEQYEQKDPRHDWRPNQSFQQYEHPIEESMSTSSPSSYRTSLGSFPSPITEESCTVAEDDVAVKPTAFQ